MNIILTNANAPRLPFADETVQCVVTSPPYWGLRDYGTAKWIGGDSDCDHKPSSTPAKRGLAKSTLGGGKKSTGHQQEGYFVTCAYCGARREDSQLGLERVPDCLGWATGASCGECYVCHMVQVFRECKRVLRPDGVLWLNLGDSYANDDKWGGSSSGKHAKPLHGNTGIGRNKKCTGLKPKDLIGIPWRVALALQADGWYLRSDIVWAKPNTMPESVTDRPTKAHEYIFLLTKSQRYFYDAEAIKEPAKIWEGQSGRFERSGAVSQHILPGQAAAQHRPNRNGKSAFRGQGHFRETNNGPANRDGRDIKNVGTSPTRNKRSVWTVATRAYSGAHFATFSPELVEPMILAGSSPKACPHCRAPWERVLEKQTEYDHTTTQHGKSKNGPYASQTGSGEGTHDVRHGVFSHSRTIGWRPTCQCENNDGSGKCIVLDPFAGTATAGVVAAKHGRQFVGTELNPKYIQLAKGRTARIQMALAV